MARTKPQPSKQSAILSAQQLQAGIDRLQKRIEEVKAFDPRSVTDQDDIPYVKRIVAAIDDALIRTFGNDSPEYERYNTLCTLTTGLIVTLIPSRLPTCSAH